VIKLNFHKSLHKYTSVKNHYFYVYDFESLFNGLKFTFPKLLINDKEFYALVYGDKKQIVPRDWIVKGKIPEEVDELWLIPLIQGAGGRFGQLAIGAALIALSFVFPPAAPGAALLSGAGLTAAAGNIILGIGINLVLSALFIDELAQPTIKGESTRRNNDFFQGLQNTVDQSIAVALHYGDVRVGGQLISGTINTINHGRDDIITVGSFFENTDADIVDLPIGATGLIDFVNGYYNLGSGDLEVGDIITETQAVTANGLDIGSLTNTAHILGPLLSLMTTLNYTVVVEWEETQSSVSQDLIFTLGSVTGSFPEDYVMMQNLGGTHPNQIYFFESLDNETNNRDVISDFSGNQDVDVGINRLAVGIDATDIKAAVNGFGFLSGAHGAGTRTGTVTLTVGAFGGWHGLTVGSKQQKIRKLTFYPLTFDESTLEGYSLG